MRVGSFVGATAAAGAFTLAAIIPAAAQSAGAAAGKIDPADTAWMIVATAFVLMMSLPGLALFYAGMVRKKNVLATMAQTFAVTALCSVLWMVVAYSLTFTGAGPIIGTFNRFVLNGIGMDTVSPLAPTIPEALFMLYQMTFAVITVALVAGSVVLPWHGLIIGVIAGAVCFYSCTSLKLICGYDDSLDVFGVHGIGGATGTLLAGVFATRAVGNVSGLLEGNPMQVLVQLYGIVVALVWSAGATFVLLKLVSAFTALRVDTQAEMEGLDVTQHGEALQ
jgi:ammonia channel protein AmtB